MIKHTKFIPSVFPQESEAFYKNPCFFSNKENCSESCWYSAMGAERGENFINNTESNKQGHVKFRKSVKLTILMGSLLHVHTAICEMNNQWGLTVWHMELCSMLYGSLLGRGFWGRRNTCMYMAESLPVF